MGCFSVDVVAFADWADCFMDSSIDSSNDENFNCLTTLGDIFFGSYFGCSVDVFVVNFAFSLALNDEPNATSFFGYLFQIK